MRIPSEMAAYEEIRGGGVPAGLFEKFLFLYEYAINRFSDAKRSNFSSGPASY
jgi:hypothetical protein